MAGTQTENIVLGTGITLEGLFSDARTGQPANVVGVYCRVRDPSGGVTTYNLGDITNPTTGTYQLDIDPEIVGTWFYVWGCTDQLKVADDFAFTVRAPRA